MDLMAVFSVIPLLGTLSMVLAGSQVWRIDSTNVEGLQWLHEEEERLAVNYKLDFWRSSKSQYRPVDIMVPSDFSGEFHHLLSTHNMTYSVMIDNVEAKIDQQQSQMRSRKISANLAEFDFSRYHSYDEIHQWVTDFATKHKDIVQKIVVGKSHEKRELAGLKISVQNTGEVKRSVWFQGGLHAREWISPATVMFITNQLVTDFKNNDATIRKILNALDFYIVPLVNPDGYTYSWKNETTRLWRKTRSPNQGSDCIGTDGNRNFPFKWEGTGASRDPCNSVYRGDKALSEVELQGLTDYALARAQEQAFIVFIDWHSYGQMWLSPWSYSDTAEPPADAKALSELGEAAVDAIKMVHGKTYVSDVSAKLLYRASGTSTDWAYAVWGAKYSYVVELRDVDSHGFLLPEDQIVPTGEECYAAVKIIGQRVYDEVASLRKCCVPTFPFN